MSLRNTSHDKKICYFSFCFPFLPSESGTSFAKRKIRSPRMMRTPRTDLPIPCESRKVSEARQCWFFGFFFRVCYYRFIYFPTMICEISRINIFSLSTVWRVSSGTIRINSRNNRSVMVCQRASPCMIHWGRRVPQGQVVDFYMVVYFTLIICITRSLIYWIWSGLIDMFTWFYISCTCMILYVYALCDIDTFLGGFRKLV